jgi:hypothetical protein
VPTSQAEKISVRPLPVTLQRAQANFGEFDIIGQEHMASRGGQLPQLRLRLSHRQSWRLFLFALVLPGPRGEPQEPALRRRRGFKTLQAFDKAPRAGVLHVIRKTAAMITLTSSTASVGVEGIVDFFLGDGPAGGGHERQAPLCLWIFLQTLGEVSE